MYERPSFNNNSCDRLYFNDLDRNMAALIVSPIPTKKTDKKTQAIRL